MEILTFQYQRVIPYNKLEHGLQLDRDLYPPYYKQNIASSTFMRRKVIKTSILGPSDSISIGSLSASSSYIFY